jgi:hypothetical protein
VKLFAQGCLPLMHFIHEREAHLRGCSLSFQGQKTVDSLASGCGKGARSLIREAILKPLLLLCEDKQARGTSRLKND